MEAGMDNDFDIGPMDLGIALGFAEEMMQDEIEQRLAQIECEKEEGITGAGDSEKDTEE